MKIKVCGMKYADNIQSVSDLKPDFMGFIFYDKSPRFAAHDLEVSQITTLPLKIKKVGVFVNEDIKEIKNICDSFQIKIIQLHGDENPDFCFDLRADGFTVIKAFGVDEKFDFSHMDVYENSCDFFLFDTKIKTHGGSGNRFDWNILKEYNLRIPYFLSGGIGLENLNEIKKIKDDRLIAIDVNSRFEIEPGLKNMSALQKLFKELKNEI